MKISVNMSFIFTSLFFFPYIITLTNADVGDLFCNADDKVALLKIRDHFGGSTGILSDWKNSTDCCTDWSSVSCDLEYQGEPGRVTTVTIGRSESLSGTLPAEFGDLPFLNFLSISDEPGITGPIPQSFSNLKMLENLELNSNSLSGSIPQFLGQLKKLKEVDLGNNQFTGTIPASVGTLASLTQFNVAHNKLTGSIPNMPKSLTSFDVSFSQLCGAIPTVLSKFPVSVFGHNKCLCGAPLPPC